MDINTPTQIVTAPAQFITAPAQPPTTGAAVYTALFVSQPRLRRVLVHCAECCLLSSSELLSLPNQHY